MTDHTPDDDSTTRRGFLRAGAAGIAAGGLSGTATIQVGASHQAGVFKGGDVEDVDPDYIAFLSGFRTRMWSSSPFASGGSTPATDIRDDLQSRIDETSGDLVAWANDRGLGSGVESVRVEFVQDGESASMVIDGTYDGTAGEWQSIDATTDYSGTPEEEVELSGSAARDAREEYDEFYERFVEPGEPISSDYVSKMAGKYGDSDNVASTLLGDNL